MTAIPFVRRTANERVDGTLTVKIDIDPMYKLQFLQMFPEIGAAGALAALVKGADIASEEKVDRPGQLCVMACTFCADPKFWEWADKISEEVIEGESGAKAFLLEMCRVTSRKHLDTEQMAADRFHKTIRTPYLAWRNQQN